jgi:dsRNA-specific ribonuclease
MDYYDPYNSHNVEVTEEDVKAILIQYGLPPTVNNLTWYRRAFVHKSYTKSQIPTHSKLKPPTPLDIPIKSKSNERLEFVGDGILEMTAKLYLYKRFPMENEGFMTEKKISLVKNEAIGKLSADMNLSRWLLLSDDAEKKLIRTNIKKLGCLFEAFVAAIFMDLKNYDMVQTFIEAVFEKHVDWSEIIHNDDNYKNKLQIMIQKEFKITPHYMEVSNTYEYGYHMAVFLCIGFGNTIHCLDYRQATKLQCYNLRDVKKFVSENKNVFLFLGEGMHKIKRKAEQHASKMALEVLLMAPQ